MVCGNTRIVLRFINKINTLRMLSVGSTKHLLFVIWFTLLNPNTQSLLLNKPPYQYSALCPSFLLLNQLYA